MYFEEIGHRVREARKAKGLTQRALAELAGLSRTTVNQLEAGVFPDIGVRKLLAILDAVGLDISLVDAARTRKSGKQPDYLKLACISANVSYREKLDEKELARALATGMAPPDKRPQLRVVFDELPPAVFDGMVRQVGAWSGEERIVKNVAAIAGQIHSTKRAAA
jgi:transcriptional regulator with XRE-family HTH domain